jgi:UDP-N-acetylglucosamine 4,6-dehydratase
MEHVKTNILGTQNVLTICKRYGVARAVLVSTDKACEPVSVYGATKLIAERLFAAAGYSVVRAGNITGSRGSISDVIAEQSPVPVTDPEMTRFYIRAEDLAQFVADTLTRGNPGVFVPEMDAYSLAEILGGRECVVVGRRPGEKKHESTVSPDEMCVRTAVGYEVGKGFFGTRVCSDAQ